MSNPTRKHSRHAGVDPSAAPDPGAATDGTPEAMTPLLSLCACGQVRMAARAVTQLYDEALRPAGMRVTQFGILAAVRWRGPLTLTSLAELTQTDRTTLTRNLRPLSRQGWVQIVPGADRREREISLTPQGRDALRAARPYWEHAQRTMAEALGPERLSRLMDDLGQATRAAHQA